MFLMGDLGVVSIIVGDVAMYLYIEAFLCTPAGCVTKL